MVRDGNEHANGLDNGSEVNMTSILGITSCCIVLPLYKCKCQHGQKPMGILRRSSSNKRTPR